jgi:hypothetical protein
MSQIHNYRVKSGIHSYIIHNYHIIGRIFYKNKKTLNKFLVKKNFCTNMIDRRLTPSPVVNSSKPSRTSRTYSRKFKHDYVCLTSRSRYGVRTYYTRYARGTYGLIASSDLFVFLSSFCRVHAPHAHSLLSPWTWSQTKFPSIRFSIRTKNAARSVPVLILIHLSIIS